MNRFMINCFVLLSSTWGYSQNVVIHFYDKMKVPVDSIESYFYERGKMKMSTYNIEVPVDTLFSYYTRTGNLRGYEVYDDGVKTGPYISYYENGVLKETGFYKKARPSGESMKWYPDGKLQQSATYSEELKDHWPLMISYFDSLGNEMVSKGNGFCRCYDLDGDMILREDGKLVNGLRDEIWMGYIDNRLAFRETYKKGEFLIGVRLDGKKEVEYKELEKQPEYPGGMEALMKFIQHNMKYPANARKNHIQGRVFVGFVVEIDGSVTNISVVKKADLNLDAEAMRVVNLMKKWNPGLQRGAPVRVRFVLPLNFKLA